MKIKILFFTPLGSLGADNSRMNCFSVHMSTVMTVVATTVTHIEKMVYLDFMTFDDSSIELDIK